MQKLARAVIGTNNIDNCSRYCQSPATMGLFRTVGYGGDSGSISDMEKADLVLIIGSNTAESHPVIATRVKSSHKLDGQKLIVSDLREHEMARRADLFLHPKPGTDLVWLTAIIRYRDLRGQTGVHTLGDGSNSAHPRFRHFHRYFEPVTDHGQLHATGNRRLSAARPQQRARSQRPRGHAEHAAGLPVCG